MCDKPATNDWDAICRRAGGRRGDNRIRQFRARLRLKKVVALIGKIGMGRGY